MASFQDNLGKLVPECESIWDFYTAKDDRDAGGENQNSKIVQSFSQIITNNIPTLTLTSQMPFLTSKQRCQSTEGTSIKYHNIHFTIIWYKSFLKTYSPDRFLPIASISSI